jgi:hypothetical protein
MLSRRVSASTSIARYAQPCEGSSRGSLYIANTEEASRASCAICVGFLTALLAILSTGVIALAFAPRADGDYAQLGGNAVCLRAGRRADMSVVYLDVGSPLQRLKLLLDLESVVQPGGESLSIFSTRLHKSLSMACNDLAPPVEYSQQCQDLALVSSNGSTSDPGLVHTTFVYQNVQAAYREGNQAAIAGLDGTFRLTTGHTYWLTSTHLCFEPLAPLPKNTPSIALTVIGDKLTTTQHDLLVHDTDLALDARCNETLRNATIRLFPIEAVNEASEWLSLSGTFLYEYGSDILDKRRRVVEAGEDCSAEIDELEHQRDIYHTDCGGLALGMCQKDAAIPYRRLSTRRMRIDIHPNGTGTLISDLAVSLRNVKQTYAEALSASLARLLVLVLTAAVVFVRGSQNATDPLWLIKNVIDALHCRRAYSEDPTPENSVSTYDTIDKWTDALISIAAWTARLVVLVYSAPTFADDRNTVVIPLQVCGLGCSIAQFILRYGLIVRKEREAPITTLGGPMSVVDVTSSVLMLFADAPLLGADNRDFAATGRLLIGLLISLSVCTRICFSASIVLTMAVSSRNGNRKDLVGHQVTLSVATLAWFLQGVATSGTLALLFVNPASISLTRSQTGDTRVVKYAIFFGLICTSLPTFTKVGLRVVQNECNAMH